MTQIEKDVISTGKSLEMEGFVFPPEEKAIWARVAKGEVSEREAVKLILGDLPIDFDHF
jgi:hypothetical protein